MCVCVYVCVRKLLCPSYTELAAIFCRAGGDVERAHVCDRISCVYVATLAVIIPYVCVCISVIGEECACVSVRVSEREGWQRSQGNCPVKNWLPNVCV